MSFSAKDFDKFLSDSCAKPTHVIMSWWVWNGYWRVKKTNKFFRWMGRKLHNKYIYWIGFQVVWEPGLKTREEFADIEPQEIDL
jgi:hypothetical protein